MPRSYFFIPADSSLFGKTVKSNNFYRSHFFFSSNRVRSSPPPSSVPQGNLGKDALSPSLNLSFVVVEVTRKQLKAVAGHSSWMLLFLPSVHTSLSRSKAPSTLCSACATRHPVWPFDSCLFSLQFYLVPPSHAVRVDVHVFLFR